MSKKDGTIRRVLLRKRVIFYGILSVVAVGTAILLWDDKSARRSQHKNTTYSNSTEQFSQSELANVKTPRPNLSSTTQALIKDTQPIRVPDPHDVQIVEGLVRELENQPGFDSYFSTSRSARSIEADLDRLGTRVVKPLEMLLTSPRQSARHNAALELGRIRNPDAINSLAALLQRKEPGEQQFDRVTAARALGDIGDQAAIPILVERLNDQYPEVRAAAVESLGKLNDKTDNKRLLYMLKNDPNAMVRMACASAFVNIQDTEAVPQLVSSLSDDSMVAEQAAIALAKMGHREGVFQLFDRLRNLAGAPDPQGTVMRGEIIDLLDKLHDSRAKEVLAKLAANDHNPEIRRKAAIALDHLED